MTRIEQINWARQILSDGEASREALAARTEDARKISELKDEVSRLDRAVKQAMDLAHASRKTLAEQFAGRAEDAREIERLKDGVLQLKRRINGMIRARKVSK